MQELLSDKDLIVEVDGKGCVLNAELIYKQGLTLEEVKYIKHLHRIRLDIEQQMREAPTKYILRGFNDCWRDIQFLLQDAWKFPRNAKFHKFWEVPRCSCPKMDNSDRLSVGYFVVNCGCPVHGE